VNSTSRPRAPLDREALGELYRKHHAQVLRQCQYLLGAVEEAEDAANDIFLRMPEALETYDSAQPFVPWLSRVTSNYCVDLLRRRRSERRVLLPADPEAPEPAAPVESPLEKLLAEEERHVVQDAVARLPEHYRRPLVERYWEEMGYHEIAQNLGLTRANVATLIFRAKGGLRRALALKASTGLPAEWAWNPTR
jgi:RNA polymerase sigma-70 factor, ECF subfamily